MQHSVSVVSQWIERVTQKNPALGGHKICPFAFKTPSIIEVSKLHEDNFVDLSFDLTIFMETDINSSYEEIENLCVVLKNKWTEHIFLPDHPFKKNYINGEETSNGYLPCIIAQSRQELTNARKILSKTDYYSYWDKDYLDDIAKFN